MKGRRFETTTSARAAWRGSASSVAGAVALLPRLSETNGVACIAAILPRARQSGPSRLALVLAAMGHARAVTLLSFLVSGISPWRLAAQCPDGAPPPASPAAARG